MLGKNTTGWIALISLLTVTALTAFAADSDPILEQMQATGLYNPKLFNLRVTPAAPEPAELKAAYEKAQLLSVEQLSALQNESPEAIRAALLMQVEKFHELAAKLKQDLPAHPEYEQPILELEEQADILKNLADDPELKQKLLAATADLAPPKEFLTWKENWKKFRKSEYYVTGGMFLGALGAEYLFKSTDPKWKGGVGPDDAIRDALRASDLRTRDTLKTAADLGVGALIAWSALEPLVVAWKEGNGTVALQSSLIDLEAYVSTMLLSGVAKKITRRERPSGEDNKSFWSGHSAQAFTAAGLLCTHHSYLSLYGNKTADRAACWAALALASAVGVARVASDSHYATDVTVGAAIGLFSGMVLPRILHYGWKASPDKEQARREADRQKRPVRFRFEAGTVGQNAVGPAGFLTGTFW